MLGVWALTLALLICLGVDFANPLLPGVVRFGEDVSVDLLHPERPRVDGRATAADPRPVGRAGILVPVVMRIRIPGAAEGLRPLLVAARPRGLIGAARTGPAPTEDH
jgi:hypothetical protein